jgi:hypothetical protein
VKQYQLRGHGAEEKIWIRHRDRKENIFRPFPAGVPAQIPSIEIDGQVVFEGCDITQEQLEAAIKQRRPS